MTEISSNMLNAFDEDKITEIAAEKFNLPDGTEPTEGKDAPTPVTHIAHCNERYWRVAARNVPIYGSVVELAKSLAPLALGRTRVIEGREGVGREHAQNVEHHACHRPRITAVCYNFSKEQSTYCNSTDHTHGVRDNIPPLLFHSICLCFVTHDVQFKRTARVLHTAD